MRTKTPTRTNIAAATPAHPLPLPGMLRRGPEVEGGKGARAGVEKEGGGEEEEEEYPDNVECDDEYDEEEVYVMVELPAAVDGEALAAASTVTIKVRFSCRLS